MKKSCKVLFYDAYTEEGHVPEVYSKLLFDKYSHTLFESKNQNVARPNVLDVSLFPSYLKPVFNIDSSTHAIKKIRQYNIKGYAIDIDETPENVAQFIKENYKKSFAQNINRLIKRFENCFDVSYKIFFGHISKTDYDFYMGSLKKMLTYRFNQRGEKNRYLENWEAYYKVIFEQINSKKCSLFVISADNVNVQICINRHNQNILNISIPSFDIAYSKFALGNISIYKVLDWAMQHNYSFVDMEYGTYEYKRRWSNNIYDFDHHIIYDKANVFSTLLGLKKFFVIGIKNSLKKYHVDHRINTIKVFFKRTSVYNKPIDFNYEREGIDTLPEEDLVQVSFENINEYNLKKLIFDSMFIHKAKCHDIGLYRSHKHLNVLYISSPTAYEKITIL